MDKEIEADKFFNWYLSNSDKYGILIPQSTASDLTGTTRSNINKLIIRGKIKKYEYISDSIKRTFVSLNDVALIRIRIKGKSNNNLNKKANKKK